MWSGKWSTKTIDPQHWNEDLLMSVEEHLSPIFDEIHDEGCDQLATEIAEHVGDAVEKLNNALKGMLNIPFGYLSLLTWPS
jgi:hypothetical protein